MSETVVLRGRPVLAKMSQKRRGYPSKGWSVTFNRLSREAIFGVAVPGTASPERSPLMSGRKTGTPKRLKFSASP